MSADQTIKSDEYLSVPIDEPQSYTPSSDRSRPHPMNQLDADETSTVRTDRRDAAQRSEDEALGGLWSGDTEPDREYRENTPTRGASNSADAPDAF